MYSSFRNHGHELLDRYTVTLAKRRGECNKKLSDLKLLTVDPEELERRTEEIKKRFVEFFGA